MAKVNFDQLFGSHADKVDFSLPNTEPLILSVPETQDNLKAMVQKLQDISEVVANGKSAAVHTGLAGTPLDPERQARSAMTPEELEEYQAWKRGVPMPEIKWILHQDFVPVDAASRDRCQRHARAMNIAWKTNQAQACNAAWLHKNKAHVIPLLEACLKASDRRSSLRARIADLVHERADSGHVMRERATFEHAEYLSIRRHRDVIMQRLELVYDELTKLRLSVHQCNKILDGREDYLRARLAGNEYSQDPLP